MTFAEWDGQANQLARGLVAAGIAPDDRVAVHIGLDNALRWLVSYTAMHRAGAVAVPLSPRLNHAEVGRMLAHCEARGSVADGELVAGDVQLDLAVVVDATVGSRADLAGGKTAVVPWDEALDPDGTPLGVPRTDNDLADILYTSGTTGHPKGVAVRHVNASMVTPGPAELERRRLVARQPDVHLRRARLRLQPDDVRPSRDLHAPLRRRALARSRREGAPGGRLPGPGHDPPAARPPADSTRPTSPRSRSALSVAPRWHPSSSSGCRRRCPPQWSPTTTG